MERILSLPLVPTLYPPSSHSTVRIKTEEDLPIPRDEIHHFREDVFLVPKRGTYCLELKIEEGVALQVPKFSLKRSGGSGGEPWDFPTRVMYLELEEGEDLQFVIINESSSLVYLKEGHVTISYLGTDEGEEEMLELMT